MNDLELADRFKNYGIYFYRGMDDAKPTMFTNEECQQIIAALRRGPVCERCQGKGGLADWQGNWRPCPVCQDKRPPSGEMVIVPKLETEAMQDSVRGILQAIRCNPGVTEDQVYQHCKLRGDSTKGLHENDGSYVTEARAAAMIYRAMIAAAEAEGRKG